MANTTTDARVQRGMEAQLRQWRGLISGGAERIGWKIGFNARPVQERLGIAGSTVGYLTGATTLACGSAHSLAGGSLIGAEPEIAIHIGTDVPGGAGGDAIRAAIAGLGPAIEVIDLDRPIEDIEHLVATNSYHRAVLFGAMDRRGAGGSLAGVTAQVLHGGCVLHSVAAAAAAGDLVEVVRLVADTLSIHGERLRAGDRIISGSLTRPLWVKPDDTVGIDLGPLGALELHFVASVTRVE